MYQFSLKGSVCGEAPKLLFTFLKALKRKLCSHSKVTNLPRVWISPWLWGMRGLDSALRGELRFLHPLTRAPTMVVDSMSPGGRSPAGWPGRAGQPCVAATVGRLPSTCDAVTAQTDRSGHFARLQPPPTHSSCAADPPSGGPGKVGDETSKGRKQKKQRRAVRRQPIHRGGCSLWQKCHSPAGKCFDLLTLHFSLKEIKFTFSAFKNDYFNVPEINHNRKDYEKKYKYNWVTLLYRRNEHSLVNQLYFHKIKTKNKKPKPTSIRQKWLDVGWGHDTWVSISLFPAYFFS